MRRAGEWEDGIGYASPATDGRRPGNGRLRPGAGFADLSSAQNGVGRKAQRPARGAKRTRHGSFRLDPLVLVSRPRLSKSQASLRASRPPGAYFRWCSWNFRWPQSALRIRKAHSPAFGLPCAGVGQSTLRLLPLGLQPGRFGLRTRSSALCVRARSVAARPYPVAVGYRPATRGGQTFALALPWGRSGASRDRHPAFDRVISTGEMARSRLTPLLPRSRGAAHSFMWERRKSPCVVTDRGELRHLGTSIATHVAPTGSVARRLVDAAVVERINEQRSLRKDS